MPAADKKANTERKISGPSRLVGVLSALQCCLFVGAAVSLPWRFDLFAVVSLAVGIVHGATAIAAVVKYRYARNLWRWQGYAGLVYVGYLLWIVGRTAFYLASNHGGLGTGLAVASGAALAAGLFLVLPTSVWAIAATGGFSGRLGLGAAVIAVMNVAAYGDAAVRAVPDRIEVRLDRMDQALHAVRPVSSARRSLYTGSPVECPAPIEDRKYTGFVHYVTVDSQFKRHCVQASSEETLGRELALLLETEDATPPLRLDLVSARRTLGGEPPLVRPFVINPGRDGACFDGRCLLPWQLVARGSFDRFAPLDFIQDLHFGASPTDIRQALAAPASEDWRGITRIETVGLLLDRDGSVTQGTAAGTAENLARAGEAAERFIVRSQKPDGSFIYRLDRTTAKQPSGRFSLARQSGTLFALCERDLRHPESRRAAKRAMRMLARRSIKLPGGRVLRPKDRKPTQSVRLGPQSLALAALLTCRKGLTAFEYDELITELGRTILAMQLPETGRFAKRFDRNQGPLAGPFSLYAQGQAVLALVLLEEALASSHPLDLDGAEVKAAVEAAMTFFGEDYFRHPMRRFFFLEENWHCIAAARAVSVHRHDAYERLCLDYLRFKQRLILNDEHGVAERFLGGYGFGNIVVPYVTPTAGFGEAAAAGVAIARARQESVPELEGALANALGYLVKHQLSSQTCFSCSPHAKIDGGFSESPVSPWIRIDYVQHAMAALTHGGRVLGTRSDPARGSEPDGRSH